MYILFEGSEESRYHLVLIRNLSPEAEKGINIDVDPFKLTVTWNLRMNATGLNFPETSDFFPTSFEPRWTKVIPIPTENVEMKESLDFIAVKLPFQHLNNKKRLVVKTKKDDKEKREK